MKTIQQSSISYSVLLIIALGVTAAIADDLKQGFSPDVISVETKDMRYTNVTYRADTLSRVLTVRLQGWQVNIPFKKIKKIYNSDYVDLKKAVLSGKVTVINPPESHIGEVGAPEYSRGEQKQTQIKTDLYNIGNQTELLWTAALRFGPDFSNSSSDYYDGITGGIGFDIGLHLAYDEVKTFSFAISKSGLRWGGGDRLVSTSSDIVIASQHTHFSATRIVAGTEYYGELNEGMHSLSMWYGYLGVGIVVNRFKTDVQLRQNSTGQTGHAVERETKVNPLVTLGVGVMSGLDGTICLNIGLYNDFVVAERTEANSLGILMILDIRAAILIPLK